MIAAWLLGAMLALAAPPSPQTERQSECAAWADVARTVAEGRDLDVDGDEVQAQLMNKGPRRETMALINIVRFVYTRRDLTPREVRRAVLVDCSGWYGVPVPPESVI